MQAIWDAYTVLKDNDDLLESVKVLLSVRDAPQRKSAETFSEFERDSSAKMMTMGASL
jgi:hypothetical protein